MTRTVLLERARNDDGAATVLAAFTLMAIMSVVVIILYVGGAVSARHQAQSAADLAALAGAGALDRGIVDACIAARDVARRMLTELTECEVYEWDVSVTVQSSITLGALGRKQAVASAIAGPAE